MSLSIENVEYHAMNFTQPCERSSASIIYTKTITSCMDQEDITDTMLSFKWTKNGKKNSLRRVAALNYLKLFLKLPIQMFKNRFFDTVCIQTRPLCGRYMYNTRAHYKINNFSQSVLLCFIVLKSN